MDTGPEEVALLDRSMGYGCFALVANVISRGMYADTVSIMVPRSDPYQERVLKMAGSNLRDSKDQEDN